MLSRLLSEKKRPVQNIILQKSARGYLLMGASSLAIALGSGSAIAQTTDDSDREIEEVVVTGIRGSLKRAQDTKRFSDGVVDAISAEDIGKFPDTNLAESLQRISGVSINRVNGEGSQVTVRGFGAGFNLVTLNGRTLPGADVALAGTDRSNAGGNSRAFDFSNLAAEGVSGIQVYKTGKASIQSGGIGATVNIETARPLDSEGFNLNVGVKGVYDTSVIQGDDITPEASGLLSWTNDAETFGISVFGSYQERDSGSAATSIADQQVFTVEDFLNPSTGLISPDIFDPVTGALVSPGTVVENAPSSGIVVLPRDSRYHVSDLSRERLNGQVVLQFKPSDNLTLTADATYARNDNEETRSDISNWFNRPFTQVIFDPDEEVGTPILLAENNNGSKDFALTQDQISTRDELESYGANIEWQATDRLKFVLDAHTSTSRVTPRLDSVLGTPQSRVEVGIAAPFVVSQSQTFSADGIPQQSIIIDSSNPDGVPGFTITDVSTTVANVTSTTQDNTVDEISLQGTWEFDDTTTFTFGANYRNQENLTDSTTTRQILGFWDAGNPGDVAEFAPGVLEQFCLTCEFDDFDTGVADNSETSLGFRGSANALFNLVSPAYVALEGTINDPVADNNNPFTLSNINSTIEEEIYAFYAQVDKDFQLFDRAARVSTGVRYVTTDVTSTSAFLVPTQVVFLSDNDFNTEVSSDPVPVAVEADYDYFLPHIDFSIDVTEDIVLRASYSRTLARPSFANLSATTSNFSFSGPTALGNVATATSGNPGLVPLISDNFDVSYEWYFDEASFITIGGFYKVVDNFIGNGTVVQPLFGLLDPASGVAGSRSGQALEILNANDQAIVSNVNLFTLTSLIDSLPNVADAVALFEANLEPNGQVNEDFFNAQNFVFPDDNDAPFQFAVDQPVNNNTGDIRGLEFAAQHFFGDTGIGLAGSYTLVDGNVGVDLAALPQVTQFALTGLSDTANATLIYEKYGISARLSYNWRDRFLSEVNRGGSNNPIFVEAFGQLDLNVSYQITDNLAVSFEGINLTGENLRINARTEGQLIFAQELAPRFLLGARYQF
jgi:TonB-dependent receptor